MISTTGLLVFWWTCQAIMLAIFGFRIQIALKRESWRSAFGAQESLLGLSVLTFLVTTCFATKCVVLINHVVARLNREYPDNPLRQFFLSTEEIDTLMKWDYLAALFASFAMWAAKATLCSAYINVYGKLPRFLRILVIAAVVHVVVAFLLSFFMFLFWCGPRPSDNWSFSGLSDLESLCESPVEVPVYYTYTALSVSTDLLLVATGILTIKHLRTSGRRENVAVAFILVIAFVSMTASLVRCGLGARLANNHNITPDTIDNALLYSLLVSLESIAALIACSLPSLRASLNKLRFMPKPERASKFNTLADPSAKARDKTAQTGLRDISDKNSDRADHDE